MKIEMEIIEKNRKIQENDLRMVPYSDNALEEDVKIMTLSERDQYVMIIENEIQKRRELLLKKRKHLKKVRNQNEFLEEVISDYGKYYDYIVEQKQEQMRALDMLNKYINGLIEKENMTSENLKDAKKEQKKIIYEIKKIKKGLDSFTEK